jgi:hypothetical protein
MNNKKEILLPILDILDILYIFIKVFRAFCFTKLTLDQLPTLNPYIWPISFFRIFTNSYFKFWSNILPNIKVGSSSFDISTLVAMEFLNRMLNIFLWIKVIFIENIV